MTSTDDVSELLSAYIDGELNDAERAAVEAAMLEDPQLGLRMAELSDVRQRIRDLPLLEMPTEFAQALDRRSPFGPVARPRRRTRTRAAALSALVSVAFWGVLVGTGSSTEVLPDLAGVVAFEAQAAAGSNETAEADQSMPAEAEGFALVAAMRRGGVDHYLYSNGREEVSVMVQRGRVDWGGLPGGERLEVAGSPAWLGTIEDRHFLVVGRGDSVYLLSGSVIDDILAMTDMMPETERSWGDKVVDASRHLVDLVGLEP
ncbi:MAG: zf-HC2 domain-containing protein [Acidimicrobiales bacterium]